MISQQSVKVGHHMLESSENIEKQNQQLIRELEDNSQSDSLPYITEEENVNDNIPESSDIDEDANAETEVSIQDDESEDNSSGDETDDSEDSQAVPKSNIVPCDIRHILEPIPICKDKEDEKYYGTSRFFINDIDGIEPYNYHADWCFGKNNPNKISDDEISFIAQNGHRKDNDKLQGYAVVAKHSPYQIRSQRKYFLELRHDLLIIVNQMNQYLEKSANNPDSSSQFIIKDEPFNPFEICPAADWNDIYYTDIMRQPLPDCIKLEDKLYEGMEWLAGYACNNDDWFSAVCHNIKKRGLSSQAAWIYTELIGRLPEKKDDGTFTAPSGWIAIKLTSLNRQEKVSEKIAAQHDSKKMMNLLLARTQYEPISITDYINNATRNQELLQPQGAERDGLGNMIIHLFRTVQKDAEKEGDDGELYHYVRPEKLQASCIVTRNSDIPEYIENKLHENNVICREYMTTTCTYLGNTNKKDNLQHILAIAIDVDDTNLNALNDMLYYDTMPQPDFITTTATGMHLYFVLKDPICMHDGGAYAAAANTNFFGSGSGTAERAGAVVIKKALENAYAFLCNKKGGIDHLSLMQLYGVPGSPTKQYANDIDSGLDFYGKQYQTYDMFQSKGSRNGHKTTIAELLDNPDIMQQVWIIMNEQYHENGRIDRPTALNKDTFTRKIQAERLGFDFSSAQAFKDSLYVQIDKKLTPIDDDQPEYTKNFIREQNARMTDAMLLMMLGWSDVLFFLDTAQIEYFSGKQDGPRMMLQRIGLSQKQYRSYINKKLNSKISMQKHNADAFIDAENLPDDSGLTDSMIAAWNANLYVSNIHGSWRYEDFVECCAQHVKTGHRFLSMRELLLCGRACGISLVQIVQDAKKLQAIYNANAEKAEEPYLSDLDVEAALILSENDADRLVSWSNAYQLSGLSDYYIAEEISQKAAAMKALRRKEKAAAENNHSNHSSHPRKDKRTSRAERNRKRISKAYEKLGPDADIDKIAKKAKVSTRTVYRCLEENKKHEKQFEMHKLLSCQLKTEHAESNAQSLARHLYLEDLQSVSQVQGARDNSFLVKLALPQSLKGSSLKPDNTIGTSSFGTDKPLQEENNKLAMTYPNRNGPFSDNILKE